ncbi:DUF2680 domain-containing protein [Clostridium sp. UBA6640]|uniref:DUF2680 domain-containing protein n=1 Tax=Clostridium sp. UBA6640 TaxID=1946370 RepID=UPI0025BB42CD|nr:DUF2680 domain-containing protein [Clostridium sp. UBA6640]
MNKKILVITALTLSLGVTSIAYASSLSNKDYDIPKANSSTYQDLSTKEDVYNDELLNEFDNVDIKYRKQILEEKTKAVDKAIEDGKISEEEGNKIKENLQYRIDECNKIMNRGSLSRNGRFGCH